MTKTLSLYYVGMSDIGYVRETNEDAWGAIPQYQFFVLADGMGGLERGEIASKKCVLYLSKFMNDLNQRIEQQNISYEEVIMILKKAIQEINIMIYQEAEMESSGKKMGTTLCCLFFFKERAIYGHVGDSRIYRFCTRKNHGKRLIQLTEDHSVANELISQKMLTKEQAFLSPYKHVLTRTIGTHPKVEPSISSLSVSDVDLFLICTDGLTNYASDSQIEEILLKICFKSSVSIEESLKKAAMDLISLAKSQGGGDNITVILVLLNPNS